MSSEIEAVAPGPRAGAGAREGVAFTSAGARAGMRMSVPLALSTLAFGLAFGALARETGLGFAEALLMSALVWAGTAQFAALEIGAAALPMLPVVAVTLAVNSRYMLLSAALRPWLSGLGTIKDYGVLALVADGNWALAMREFSAGRVDAGILVGSGALMYIAWLGGTGWGHVLGATIANPERWGLDFVATAFFVTILMAMEEGRASILPWTIAGVSATLTALLLPGHWYLLVGALAGSLAGALRDGG